MDKWTDDYKRGDHAIHVYNTDSEREKALFELVNWSNSDEKIICLTDKWSSGSTDGAKDPGAGRFNSDVRKGRVEIRPSYSSYCPGGKFLGQKMFELWDNIHKDVAKQGYEGLIVIGDVSWLRTHESVFGPFMKYEQGIDFARLPRNLTILCQYDQRLFSSDQLDNAVRVHQLQLSEGRLERKHWFILRRTTESGDLSESLKKPSIISESFMR
jgi:hypothetical protein